MRPVGIEPTYPVSKTGTLSIELWARYYHCNHMEKPKINQRDVLKLPNEFLATKESQGLIKELREKFYANSFEEFKSITEGINVLYEQYKSQFSEGLNERLQNQVLMSPIFFEAIAGRDYIAAKEAALRNLRGEHGIYIPFEEEGGGDFWGEDATGASVGSMKLLDVVGHGVASLPLKIFVMRAIEIYKNDHSENQENLFGAIDELIAKLPNQTTADYTEVEIKIEGEKRYADIECAGGIRIFIRYNATGGIYEAAAREGYPPLGVGAVALKGRQKIRVVIPQNADIYITSDGLSEIMDFVEFGEIRKKLTADVFRESVMDFIQQSRGEQKVHDDVTVVILK